MSIENILPYFLPGIIPSAFHVLFHFILTTALWGSYYHDAHFIGEGVEAGLYNLLIWFAPNLWNHSEVPEWTWLIQPLCLCLGYFFCLEVPFSPSYLNGSYIDLEALLVPKVFSSHCLQGGSSAPSGHPCCTRHAVVWQGCFYVCVCLSFSPWLGTALGTGSINVSLGKEKTPCLCPWLLFAGKQSSKMISIIALID